MDSVEKYKLIDKINKYIESNLIYIDDWEVERRDYDKIEILLGMSGINYVEHNLLKSLKKTDDNRILELYKNITNNNDLVDLFKDKYAIDILNEEKTLSNLNLYLKECFKCSKEDKKIATAMLLRSCVEIFISIWDNTRHPLDKKIDNFFLNIQDNKEFKIFIEHNKQNQLKQFLKDIKDFGNNAAHLNDKNIEDVINKYDNKEILKLFCILIEHSILKDGIKKKNEEEATAEIRSINFTVNDKNSAQEDDEFPF
jgi:hypothetical protein